MKSKSIKWYEENIEETREIYKQMQEGLEATLVTRVKVEQALNIREKPSEEQVKKFRKRLLINLD